MASDLPDAVRKACSYWASPANTGLPNPAEFLASALLAEVDRRIERLEEEYCKLLNDGSDLTRNILSECERRYMRRDCPGCTDHDHMTVTYAPPPPPAIEPCPWCGGEARLRPGEYGVRCSTRSCLAEGPADDPTGARWNEIARKVREART